MSKTPPIPNAPSTLQKHKSATSQIQHYYDYAIDILSKNTQLFLNYLKYLAECSRQLKKVNETLAGLTCGKNAHPQLKDTLKIFESLENNNQEIRKFMKSDEVKNSEKRESRENDFIAKKKQELKKTLAQIINLHNDVIRIIKKPPDCINCFNALEDGFKYHCSYLFYCTRLTLCQDKLLGCVDEIHEEVLSIRKDLAKLQYECNTNTYKLFLQYNPQYNNTNVQEKDPSVLPTESSDQISEKFNHISKQVKKSVCIYREPQFPSLHLFHFSSPFKRPDESDTEIHSISVGFTSSTPLLIEPEKILKDKSVTDILTPLDIPDDLKIDQPNQEDSIQSSHEDSNQEARLEDFLASDSGSSSDEEPFHELNSSFPSMIADTPLDNNASSGGPSPVNSNQSPLKSVIPSESSANYHQKISSVLAAKPRTSMKFIAMKQYKCEDFGKELSVKEKEVVQVLDANMMEYWYCKKGNSEGFLPAIILEPYTDQSNKRLKSMMVKESPPI